MEYWVFPSLQHPVGLSDFGRAVSRILSAPANRGRESFVSAADTRNLSRRGGRRSGPLRGFLLGLAPDGVFRALPISRQAVSSCLTFSPLPRPCGRGGLIFCGTFRQNALKRFARVYPPAAALRGLRGIAPSGVRTFLPRPACTGRKRFSALPKPPLT